MSIIPHPIPYQGSKRKLAPAIHAFANNKKYDVLYEPFAGSAAFSLYAAHHGLADRYVLGDAFESLIDLWKLIINHPEKASSMYKKIWDGQKQDDFEYFNRIRSSFNEHRDPVHLLYLIVRCVKNAVRFNNAGNFSQSADKRRKGTRPETMEKQIYGASQLLKGRVDFFVGDFTECVSGASSRDLIYMDPPYQGTSQLNDKRYYEQLHRETLCDFLAEQNHKNVDYLLSYDGKTGEKIYGDDLPESLNLKRIYINAGRSTQATLVGKKEVTLESLYFSPSFSGVMDITNDAEYSFQGQIALSI
ncbi:DNA adenine methylase [Bermanella sp. WJH001]|uniref:DNA adenine methylase n=1 Tax=Bermanella sp. WJH001 TaxID=3048005 RepID=UPI0024BEEB45|nr:DNA adenine methylase [Bermanella sp. WJH001]MDJ1538935.1 DNA adenine methylase [Bermanella sp. WJH001]